VAWIDVDWTPQLPQERLRNIILTFSAAWGDIGGTYNKLEMPLEGEDAEEFWRHSNGEVSISRNSNRFALPTSLAKATSIRPVVVPFGSSR
jgi:hypothetical protein